MLNGRDQATLATFAARLRRQLPTAEIWAFDSRARGNASPDSDFDICVVTDLLDRETWDRISDVAWEVGFDNDLVITTVKMSRADFRRGPLSESPLVSAILREGVKA
jgi:predicted nucleotidyltransferase